MIKKKEISKRMKNKAKLEWGNIGKKRMREKQKNISKGKIFNLEWDWLKRASLGILSWQGVYSSHA